MIGYESAKAKFLTWAIVDSGSVFRELEALRSWFFTVHHQNPRLPATVRERLLVSSYHHTVPPLLLIVINSQIR